MKKVLISIVILFSSFLSSYSQDINSLYFLNGWSQRNSLNASFAPENGYISFPVISGITLNLSSNTGLSNFFYTYNNNSVTFLHPSVDAQQFLSSLQPNTIMHQGMNLNLFSLGFFTASNSFWSFDVSLKETFDANIPIDFFRLAKSGIQDQTNDVFNLKNLNITQTNIARFSLGYSRDINAKWRVGLNAKILAGLSYEKINYSQFDVHLSNNQYSLAAVGESQIRSEFLSFDTDENGNYDFSKGNFDMSKLKPAGFGAAFDIGVTYKPMKKLKISAAVNDIGFINWNASAIKDGTANSNVAFNGFTNTNVDSIDIATQVNKFKEDLNSLIKFKEAPTSNNIIESIPYTLKASAEYSIFGNDKHDITLGMLWNSYNTPYDHINELVGAVTFKPFSWFAVSTTCEFLRPESNRFGVALNFSPKWINIFVASDYIVPKLNNQYLPVDKFNLNLSIGVSIGIGRPKDTDKDGVVDRLDKCPDTPLGIKVDKKGCPLDADGDGVPDYLDKCPDTPKEASGKVDKNGCPLDSDGDGVPDYLDQCPNTPASARGLVNAQGCPIDSDNDGVPDYLDKCANTPAGVQIDSVGCPIDTDGDGVPDYLDLCPGTPPQAKGFVDKNGCPLDTDGDGVPDYLDKCPGTPLEAHGFTDKNGCILDSDGDGVPDYLDKCPDTPAEARGKVDEHGCPLDVDGDGIPDYLDKCPTIPGVKSNNGCPELKKEIRALFLKALKGIQFESGKPVIKKTSFVLLNKIAQVIKDNPSFLVEIRDHTEITGIANNMILSQNRATAVRNYLIKRGVSERKITANGVGDKTPVESNNILAERILKQCVEFIVTYE